jgi:hypothetical protein
MAWLFVTKQLDCCIQRSNRSLLLVISVGVIHFVGAFQTLPRGDHLAAHLCSVAQVVL